MKYESALKTSRNHRIEGVSACLLIKDDNNRLIEWLAYHYHVLPLRNLIIAIDPDSRNTPLPILQRWDDTDLNYTLWNDNDYMSGPMILKRKRQKAVIMDLKNDDEQFLKEIVKLHDERQKHFLSQCYKHLKLTGHDDWVVHIDTDEFVVFNTISDDDPSVNFDAVNSEHSKYQTDRKRLPKIGEATVLDVIAHHHSPTCVSMPRLLFGAVEADELEKKKINRLTPSIFDSTKFDTLRFLRHYTKGINEKKFKSRLNGLTKVFINLSQVPISLIKPENIHSIHRPFIGACPDHNTNAESYYSSLFRVNHYLGSWEEFNERDDKRRNKNIFETKANVNEGPSYDAVPWLQSFVDTVGTKNAKSLLMGIGDIQNARHKIERWSKNREKTCALLFFGLASNVNENAISNIKLNILDINPDCDVFVHTYTNGGEEGFSKDDTNDETIRSLHLLTDSSKLILSTKDKSIEMYEEFFSHPFSGKNIVNTTNTIREWISINAVWNMMERYEENLPLRYDRVGLFELNDYYADFIKVQNSEESAVIPTLMHEGNTIRGLNDRLFYGERAYAEVWATERFTSVSEYTNWLSENDQFMGSVFQIEHFMRYLLVFKWAFPLTIKNISLRKNESHEIMESVPGVIVLGMHRSGTSLLTGLLSNIFSWNVPGQQVTAKDKSQNPKGFYENLDVTRQNDEWLEEQSMSWNRLEMKTGPTDPNDIMGGFDPEIAGPTGKHGNNALLQFNSFLNQPWALKDPRMCLTLCKWLDVLEGPSPPVLFTYRNPFDVARSLYVRKSNGIPMLKGLELWIWYNREAIRLSKNSCRVITSNEEILQGREKELVRIQDELSKCGLQPRSYNLDIMADFINPNFQHGTQNTEEIDNNVFRAFFGNANIEKGRDLYEKAMRVFFDMKSGEAFHDDYVWPVMYEIDS